MNAAASPQGAAINPVNFVWVILAFGALTAAIAVGNLWLVNFLHVIAGAMWTGIDLFMGFVIGPILRASIRSAPGGHNAAHAKDAVHYADAINNNWDQRLIPGEKPWLSRLGLSAIYLGVLWEPIWRTITTVTLRGLRPR